MATEADINQQLVQLEQEEAQAESAIKTKLPERRFTSGVTRGQQQNVLEFRQSGRDFLVQAQNRRQQLENARSELRRIEAEKREIEIERARERRRQTRLVEAFGGKTKEEINAEIDAKDREQGISRIRVTETPAQYLDPVNVIDYTDGKGGGGSVTFRGPGAFDNFGSGNLKKRIEDFQKKAEEVGGSVQRTVVAPQPKFDENSLSTKRESIREKLPEQGALRPIENVAFNIGKGVVGTAEEATKPFRKKVLPSREGRVEPFSVTRLIEGKPQKKATITKDTKLSVGDVFIKQPIETVENIGEFIGSKSEKFLIRLDQVSSKKVKAGKLETRIAETLRPENPGKVQQVKFNKNGLEFETIKLQKSNPADTKRFVKDATVLSSFFTPAGQVILASSAGRGALEFGDPKLNPAQRIEGGIELGISGTILALEAKAGRVRRAKEEIKLKEIKVTEKLETKANIGLLTEGEKTVTVGTFGVGGVSGPKGDITVKRGELFSGFLEPQINPGALEGFEIGEALEFTGALFPKTGRVSITRKPVAVGTTTGLFFIDDKGNIKGIKGKNVETTTTIRTPSQESVLLGEFKGNIGEEFNLKNVRGKLTPLQEKNLEKTLDLKFGEDIAGKIIPGKETKFTLSEIKFENFVKVKKGKATLLKPGKRTDIGAIGSTSIDKVVVETGAQTGLFSFSRSGERIAFTSIKRPGRLNLKDGVLKETFTRKTNLLKGTTDTGVFNIANTRSNSNVIINAGKKKTSKELIQKLVTGKDMTIVRKAQVNVANEVLTLLKTNAKATPKIKTRTSSKQISPTTTKTRLLTQERTLLNERSLTSQRTDSRTLLRELTRTDSRTDLRLDTRTGQSTDLRLDTRTDLRLDTRTDLRLDTRTDLRPSTAPNIPVLFGRVSRGGGGKIPLGFVIGGQLKKKKRRRGVRRPRTLILSEGFTANILNLKPVKIPLEKLRTFRQPVLGIRRAPLIVRNKKRRKR